MTKQIEVTSNTFNKQWAGFKKGVMSQRDKLNAFLLFAIQHYQNTGHDCTYLNTIVNDCIDLKAVPTKSVKAFIKAHVNVAWVKLSDDNYGYKREGKAAKVTMPTVKWYEFETGHNARKDDLDAKAQVARLVKTMEKNINESNYKDMAAARNLKTALAKLVA